MEVESSSAKDLKPIGADCHQTTRKRRRNICLAVIAVVLGIVLLLVVLGLTVFKAKPPITTIDSFALKDLQLSVDLRLKVNLNITLDVNLSITNPNKVGFKYTNSSAYLNYRGEEVGEAPVPAGKIEAGQTLPMNLTLTLLADRLLSNSDLYSDFISGALPFTYSSRISGKARIVIFDIDLVSYTTCDFNVGVLNRSITNQTCHYKTEL